MLVGLVPLDVSVLLMNLLLYLYQVNVDTVAQHLHNTVVFCPMMSVNNDRVYCSWRWLNLQNDSMDFAAA